MSGVILAVLDRPEIARRVLEDAARLADLTGAGRINVLAIRTPPLSTIMPSEEILTAEHEQRIRTEEDRRTEALRQIFDAWARTVAGAALTTEWADPEGMADALVAEWGRRADFIVMKRPMDHPLDQEQLALHAALFDCGRPVLVVPPQSPPSLFGRRIAFAWREDDRTIQAVLAGLRCATKADAVHVLAGTRDVAHPPSLPDILDEHGIAAKLHVLQITGEQAFGATLLQAAHRVGADLLVMGAFARNSLRSLILGGVTRYMLAHADLPLLLRH